MDNVYIDSSQTVKIGYQPYAKMKERASLEQQSNDIIQAGVCLY